MMIDSDTARNLELVGNMSVRKSAHSLFGYIRVSPFRLSLVVMGYMRSLLNHTYTAMGARLLRVNILAPITGQSRATAFVGPQS